MWNAILCARAWWCRRATYEWSSAAAHVGAGDASGTLDLDWWRRECPPDWSDVLAGGDPEDDPVIRRCTYSGRPFGEDSFVTALSERFGRHWTRGRPKEKTSTAAHTTDGEQLGIFDAY